MKFQPLAITINRTYAILKLGPKFTMSQAAHSKSNYCKKCQPFSTVNIKHLIGFRSNSFFIEKRNLIVRDSKKGVFEHFSLVYKTGIIFSVSVLILGFPGLVMEKASQLMFS